MGFTGVIRSATPQACDLEHVFDTVKEPGLEGQPVGFWKKVASPDSESLRHEQSTLLSEACRGRPNSLPLQLLMGLKPDQMNLMSSTAQIFHQIEQVGTGAVLPRQRGMAGDEQNPAHDALAEVGISEV
jgi:hypothetical protein